MKVEGTDERLVREELEEAAAFEQLTVDDILAEAEEVQYHTLLEVWQFTLASAETERTKKITPQWANRITSAYREVNFGDMPMFQTRFFDKLAEIKEVLDTVIAGDEECLKKATPEDDAKENDAHYRLILSDWQRIFLTWELRWSCADSIAPVELAAISEVHRLLFGDSGLVSYLDNIPFEFTEVDQQALLAELAELRDTWEG